MTTLDRADAIPHVHWDNRSHRLIARKAGRRNSDLQGLGYARLGIVALCVVRAGIVRLDIAPGGV